MKKLFKYFMILSVTVLFFVFPISGVFAAEKEVKGDVSVAGTVPSQVSTTYSTATISVNQVLADASQSAVITVLLKDGTQTPMDGINVCVYSNRGALDRFVAVDGSGNIINPPASQIINGNTCIQTKTDSQGYGYIKLTSNVPGVSQITVIADNTVQLNSLKLTFLPLPFPKYVSIGFEVPKFITPSGEITIFKPSKLPGEGPQNTELVNLGVRIVIPFWVVILLVFFLILTPILFIVIISLLARIRRLNCEEKTEIEETKQIIEEEKEQIKEIAEEKTGPHGSNPPDFPQNPSI